MKTVILCGGRGTRIREASELLPKPMISLGDYPILVHIMNIYSHFGHNEFILCLGYKGWLIKEYFLNFQAENSDITVILRNNKEILYHNRDWPDWRITMVRTGLDAMTGCRIKRIQKYIDNQTFMLTYGDGVGNINVEKLLEFHKSHGRLATITSVRPPSRFGELTMQGSRVSSFEEKPQVMSGLINGGFFVCEPGVFDYLTDDESCNFEREPLQNLAKDGQLMSYYHDGFWMPMDTYREFKLLNDMLTQKNAPWIMSG